MPPGGLFGGSGGHLWQQRRQHGQDGSHDQPPQNGPNLHWLCLLTPPHGMPGPSATRDSPTNHRWPDKHPRDGRNKPIRNLTYPEVRCHGRPALLRGGSHPGGGGWGAHVAEHVTRAWASWRSRRPTRPSSTAPSMTHSFAG